MDSGLALDALHDCPKQQGLVLSLPLASIDTTVSES